VQLLDEKAQESFPNHKKKAKIEIKSSQFIIELAAFYFCGFLAEMLYIFQKKQKSEPNTNRCRVRIYNLRWSVDKMISAINANTKQYNKEKPRTRIACRGSRLVDPKGIEPSTSRMRTERSPS
jgi:hypothetical protein